MKSAGSWVKMEKKRKNKDRGQRHSIVRDE
jgi:hypothetical protein